MALPPPAVNDVVQVGIESRVFGQRVLLTHYYRFTTASGSTPVDTVLSTFLANISQGAQNDIVTAYCATIGNNQVVSTVSAQVIYPTRYSRISFAQNAPGTWATNANTPNTAGTITFQDGLAGRSHRATKHIGAMPATAAVAGLLVGGYRDALTDLAGTLATAVAAGAGYVLTPVIFHKNADGPLFKSTLITSWTVGETARTMRRRTVGLGE